MMLLTRPQISKIKAAFISPCIGIGGADGLMTSLIRHAFNIEWTGVAISSRMTKEMVGWASNSWDPRVPIHTVKKDLMYDGINYHEQMADAVYAACKDAQIIVTWGYPNLPNEVRTLDIPIIEYVQNCDEYAQEVIEKNKPDYKAACSITASKIFGDTKDVHIIYNGIDPSRVTPRKGRELQRKVWGIPEDKKVILFMGRLVEEKHPEDLIRAICELDDTYIGIFCGFGKQQPEIYNLIQRFCPNRIAFVPMQYHIGDALAAADCFLLPSDFEGHPLALMEAMLAGVPCVYTDFDVMPELHQMFGELGYMVKRGCKSEELALAIISACEPSDETFTHVNNARAVVWENFTISTIAHRWEEYIEACLFDWWRKKRLTTIHPVSEPKPLTKPIYG